MVTGAAPLPRPRLVIGREQELWAARAALIDPPDDVRVLSLTGERGVGKTVLAAELAWELREWFADGCIRLGLADLGDPRTSWEEMIFTLHAAVTGTKRDVRQPTDRLIIELQHELRRRKLLVILDDVENEGQIIDVLPRPGSQSAMVITSLRPLANIPGVRLNLGVLSEAAASELLSQLVHSDEAFPAEAREKFMVMQQELLRVSGGLPLAVRMLAAFFASNSNLEDASVMLRNEKLRRVLGERGGESPSLQAVLAVIYGQLSPDTASIFRSLALLPEGRFKIKPDGRLSSGPVDAALRELQSVGLIHAVEGGFEMHPMTRSFARERLAEEGAESISTPSPKALNVDLSRLASLTSVRDAAHRDERGQVGVQEHALRTAQSAGDVIGEIQALVNLGELQYRAGHYEDASDAFRFALSVAERAGDLAAVAELQLACGRLEHDRQALHSAEQHYRSSADTFAALGDLNGRARALTAVGDVLLVQNNLDAAESAFHGAIDLYLTMGAHAAKAALVGRLGKLAETRGQFERAKMLYSMALREFEAGGDMASGAETNLRLGLLAAQAGDLEHAAETLSAAERSYLRINALNGAARASLGLSAVALLRGDLAIAEDAAQHALNFAVKAQEKPIVAISTYVKGIVALEAGQRDDALELLESAVARSRAAALPLAEAQGLAALSSLLKHSGSFDAAEAAGFSATRLFERLDVTVSTPEEVLLTMLTDLAPPV